MAWAEGLPRTTWMYSENSAPIGWPTLAIEKGWMTGEGAPVHSVCPADEVRRLAG